MFALKSAKIIYTIKAMSSRWNFVYAGHYIQLVLFREKIPRRACGATQILEEVTKIIWDPQRIHPCPAGSANMQNLSWKTHFILGPKNTSNIK